MEENKEKREIDLRQLVKKLKEKKKVFLINLPIIFILSCIYIFSIPRYYMTDLKLAPEADNAISGGALGSLASSFGFDLSNMQTTDAISPLLYPDLMQDNGFVSELLTVKVRKRDGSVETSYFDFLKKHLKYPWWNKILAPIKQLFKAKEEPVPGKGNGKGKKEVDPYFLTKTDADVYDRVREDIVISTDKKTGVITISVKQQDPLVCRILADSVKTHLQAFITTYRTRKARTDVDYYTHLANEALKEYETARRRYGGYADANMDVVLESYRAKQEDLENDMQLKYNTYSTINTQLQASKAKVQERTPAFTLIKGATVPVKPAGPKRVFFVLGMLILSFMAIAFWILREELHFKF